jgi:cytochrome c biogenesis protein CcdA/thiol-disulfide isomerase/thioredoxin
MHASLINIGLAFLEGLALILSPCILPILPIVLSGSLTGGKRRPLGIITGFILAFTVVTLFSRSLVVWLDVSQETLRHVSYGILLLLGIVMLSTTLTEKFNFLTQRLMRVGNQSTFINNPEGGYVSGFLFGLLIGIIWTPCAGPILAAVIVQAITQATSWESCLIVIAFGIGAGIPMLLIAFLGRRLLNQFSFFTRHAREVRRGLGVIIVLTVLGLMYGGTPLSTPLPAATDLPHVTTYDASHLVNGLQHPYPAPPIEGITAWINSPPLKLDDFKGKVVLIDFWTYSCINCIRTLPYLKAWYDQYHALGLEIIGIHSPEFQFEQNLENVQQSVEKLGIPYPVALDNQFITWQNYHNEYWPAHYLIDQTGQVVYEDFGEGEYDVTENNIRFLLGLHAGTTQAIEEHYSAFETPETYLGYARAENFDGKALKNQSALYRYPSELSSHHWALQGKWIIDADKIISANAGASIKIHFDAGKVYAVMGSDGKPIAVKLLLNGLPLTHEQGQDVVESQIEVNQDRLYALIQFNQESEGTLELIALSPGLEIYTFTFGG